MGSRFVVSWKTCESPLRMLTGCSQPRGALMAISGNRGTVSPTASRDTLAGSLLASTTASLLKLDKNPAVTFKMLRNASNLCYLLTKTHITLRKID